MDKHRDRNLAGWIIIESNGKFFGTPDLGVAIKYDPLPPDTAIFNTRAEAIKAIELYALQHEKEIALTVTANRGGSGWIILAVIAVLVMADSKR